VSLLIIIALAAVGPAASALESFAAPSAHTPKSQSAPKKKRHHHLRKHRTRPEQSSTKAPVPAITIDRRVDTSDPVVFLTIDDGWNLQEPVPGIMMERQVPFSIFVIQTAARKRPEYFRSLIKAGATIEDHTYDHPYLTRYGLARQRIQVCLPLADFQARYAHRPQLFRPSYGQFNDDTLRAMNSCGLRHLTLWSTEMKEGRLDNADGRLHPGDIVLMHFDWDLQVNLKTFFEMTRDSNLEIGSLESYLVSPPAIRRAAKVPSKPAPSPSPSEPTSPVPPLPTLPLPK